MSERIEAAARAWAASRRSAAGQRYFKENGLLQRKCTRCVEDCARLAEELLPGEPR